MPNMAEYVYLGTYLGARNMVKWGVPAKILQKPIFGLNKPIYSFIQFLSPKCKEWVGLVAHFGLLPRKMFWIFP